MKKQNQKQNKQTEAQAEQVNLTGHKRKVPAGKGGKLFIEQLFFHAGKFHTQIVSLDKIKHENYAEQTLKEVLPAQDRIGRLLICQKLA